MSRSALIISIIFLVACHRTESLVSSEVRNLKDAIKYVQTNEVKLSPVGVNVDSVLFVESSSFGLTFPMDDVSLYYAIDQNDYQVFEDNIIINQSAAISFFAHKPEYINSDTSSIQVIRCNKNHKQLKLNLSPNPNNKYPGGGSESFIDLKKGGLNFRSGNIWSGFQSEMVEFNFDFESESKIEEVIFSCLSDHGSWIFMPDKIEIYEQSKLVGETKLNYPYEAEPAACQFVTIPVLKGVYKNLHVKVYTLNAIPSWHPGQGSMPWLFIDEIILN